MQFFLALLFAVLALGMGGCDSMPRVEACYSHPVYGEVCFKIGGKLAYSSELTPEQRAEVEKWAKEKGLGNSP